jgi:DNA invertase Pin-like site-specific DNA recombinase
MQLLKVIFSWEILLYPFPDSFLHPLQFRSLRLLSFHSFTEAHLAIDNELVRNILLALLASLAKVEAQKISERTKAGMARAKAKGKRIGRPPVETNLRSKIASRVAEVGAYAAAKELGVDRKTAMKYSNA